MNVGIEPGLWFTFRLIVVFYVQYVVTSTNTTTPFSQIISEVENSSTKNFNSQNRSVTSNGDESENQEDTILLSTPSDAPTKTGDDVVSNNSTSKFIVSSTTGTATTRSTIRDELSSTEPTTTSSSYYVTVGAVKEKIRFSPSNDHLNSSCQFLKCEHDAECIMRENFAYCNCGWAYSGYNCHNALPLYLVIGLSASCALVLLLSSLSLICFIRSNKKIVPTHNGVQIKEQIKPDTLFDVDESIYSDPTDFYSGEPAKGAAVTPPMTVPKIPRIPVPKLDLDSYTSIRDCTSSDYQTFHPKKSNAQKHGINQT